MNVNVIFSHICYSNAEKLTVARQRLKYISTLNIAGSYSSFHRKMAVLAGEIQLWGYGSKYVNILPIG
jgi:hypothetical protein